jgi:hypothetical protein
MNNIWIRLKIIYSWNGITVTAGPVFTGYSPVRFSVFFQSIRLDLKALVLFEDEDDEGGEEGEKEQPDKEDAEDVDVDELEELSEDEQNRVLEETAVIRVTVTKVSNLKRSRSHF